MSSIRSSIDVALALDDGVAVVRACVLRAGGMVKRARGLDLRRKYAGVIRIPRRRNASNGQMLPAKPG